MSDIKIYKKELENDVELTIFQATQFTPAVEQQMSEAVDKYVDGQDHTELIEIYLNNPYLRVVIKGNLEKLPQEDFEIAQ